MASDVVEQIQVQIYDVSTPAVHVMHTNGLNCSTGLNPYCPNSTTEEDYEAQADVEKVISIVVSTIFGVIVLLGLLGNFLVMLVVISDKHMRNTTNILILSLAVADLLFIVFCVPFTAVQYAMANWPFGSVWCKVVQYIIFVCAYASVYTLVLMSLDRYLAVVHAIRSMSIRNERNTWLAVAITWFTILAGHVPLLMQYEVFHYKHFAENRSVCINIEQMNNKIHGQVFQMSFLAFGYVIPLSIVCALYGMMLKRLLYGVVPGGNQSQESIRAKKRVTRMVIIVVIIFAVCWLPIQVILVIQKFNAYPVTGPFVALQISSNCFAYMNSCVNPFLYAFLSDNFRRSFHKVLCCSTLQPSARRMDYERTNVRYSEKETKETRTATTNSRYTEKDKTNTNCSNNVLNSERDMTDAMPTTAMVPRSTIRNEV